MPIATNRLSSLWQGGDFQDFFDQIDKRVHYSVKKGTVLFNEGEPLSKIFFIKKGFVKLYRLSSEGRETTIYLYGPGQILGVRALTTEDECARHFAEAITDLDLIIIYRQDYLEALKTNPEYLLDLLHVFIDRLNYTERKLEGFIITDVTSRVAYFLLDIAQRFCEGKVKNFQLPLPLTHQRIAEFVGSFRETVTLSLNKLQKEGVLIDERGKITILDLEKLKKCAQNTKS
jgi:CRP/FNR family transcriptional regulator, cyclic AMP receptor protein